MKIVSGHQPAYLPWSGYFHKLSLADVFVYMDTVQYLDADWNNRNKIRTPQGWSWLTVPIDKKHSTGNALNQKLISQAGEGTERFWQIQHWRTLQANYSKTPFFADYAEQLEAFYTDKKWHSLHELCWEQFKMLTGWLQLEHIPVVKMSDRKFSGYKDDLILDHCHQLQGDAVVLGALGRNYLNVDKFTRQGIRVYFQSYNHPVYQQRFNGFEPYMTVLDVLFNYGDEASALIMDNNINRQQLLTNQYWENNL